MVGTVSNSKVPAFPSQVNFALDMCTMVHELRAAFIFTLTNGQLAMNQMANNQPFLTHRHNNLYVSAFDCSWSSGPVPSGLRGAICAIIPEQHHRGSGPEKSAHYGFFFPLKFHFHFVTQAFF